MAMTMEKLVKAVTIARKKKEDALAGYRAAISALWAKAGDQYPHKVGDVIDVHQPAWGCFREKKFTGRILCIAFAASDGEVERITVEQKLKGGGWSKRRYEVTFWDKRQPTTVSAHK